MNPCIHSNRFDSLGDELIVHAGYSDIGEAGFFISCESFYRNNQFRTPKIFYKNVEDAIKQLNDTCCLPSYKLRRTLESLEQAKNFVPNSIDFI